MHLLRSILLVTLLGIWQDATAQVSTAPPAFSAPTGPAAPSPDLFTDPAEACAHVGGHYLGDLKCGLANGKTVSVMAGPEILHARESATVVPYGTPHSWALATAAITFQHNGYRHDLLGGLIATPDVIPGERRLLDQWWDVKTRDDLLKRLEWLQYTGHRKAFEEQGLRIDKLDNRQFQFALETPSLDEQGRNELNVVRRYHQRLGTTGILAWDLVRYISLCRWGYLVGFLSDDEAWKLIMPAALSLQRAFGSWKELQDNFLIGRQYWSLQQTRQNGTDYQQILDRLLQDRSGPLLRNKWDMDLHVAAPLPTFSFGSDH